MIFDEVKLINEKRSSNKYGDCEVCKKFCNEVFYLQHPFGLFGHEKCLQEILEQAKNKSRQVDGVVKP